MSEKHAGGRPPKYKTKEEIQEKIDEYFKMCKLNNKPYTITGLGLALDMSRQDLINYSKKDEFFDTIKRAKMRVENYLEERLINDSSATGIIFNLKNNYGWKDKQENVNVGVSYEDYIKRVEDEEEY
ncbi:MAG: DNA-packaging protein [Clostridia bacterium]|nr:DNA-packaging protein [Clostridia bacterium]